MFDQYYKIGFPLKFSNLRYKLTIKIMKEKKKKPIEAILIIRNKI